MMKTPRPPYKFKVGDAVYVRIPTGVSEGTVTSRKKVKPLIRGDPYSYVYSIRFAKSSWGRVPEVQVMTFDEAVADRLME